MHISVCTAIQCGAIYFRTVEWRCPNVKRVNPYIACKYIVQVTVCILVCIHLKKKYTLHTIIFFWKINILCFNYKSKPKHLDVKDEKLWGQIHWKPLISWKIYFRFKPNQANIRLWQTRRSGKILFAGTIPSSKTTSPILMMLCNICLDKQTLRS